MRKPALPRGAPMKSLPPGAAAGDAGVRQSGRNRARRATELMARKPARKMALMRRSKLPIRLRPRRRNHWKIDPQKRAILMKARKPARAVAVARPHVDDVMRRGMI